MALPARGEGSRSSSTGSAGQSEPPSCRRAGATRADHSSHGALVLGEECVTGLFMTHLIGFGRLEFRMYRRPHTTDSFYSFFLVLSTTLSEGSAWVSIKRSIAVPQLLYSDGFLHFCTNQYATSRITPMNVINTKLGAISSRMQKGLVICWQVKIPGLFWVLLPK